MTAPLPAAVKQVLEVIGPSGTILFFVPTNPKIWLEINLWNLWQKEITITYSYTDGLHNLKTVLAWIRYRKINVTDMITHVFSLIKTVEGFQ